MPAVDVTETPVASRQVAGLRGAARKSYDKFLDHLAARGCEAMGYRLSGPEPLPRLCVKHLRGADRVIVGFNDAGAWVLLVGPHDDADPGLDVYRLLYELAGVEAEDGTKRTKPSCCDVDGEPPEFSSEQVDDLVARAKALNRRR